jgi:hypothetical protein
VAEEVSDDVERDATLQKVHSLCVSEGMWTYCSIQTETLASCPEKIFLKDVADSRTRQPFMVRVLEKGLLELFWTIKMVFLQMIAQNLDRTSHQRYSAHLSSLPQKAQLRGGIQAHVSD